MPSLSLERDSLVAKLGKSLTENEIADISFDFGVELDDIYDENGKSMLKFDIPANRYDLLCLEGFVAALRAYLEIDKFEDLILQDPTVHVMKHKTHERMHIACGIIRGIKFTPETYESFLSYQTKLHGSIGRNRALVAIGTHDMAKIKDEITYKSVDLDSVSFTPLKMEETRCSKEIKGSDLEKYFINDRQISKYFRLLSDKDRAVAFMCGETVMSLPPIINSETTKISPDTTDIFVEVTGSNFNRVNSVLKHILYNFRGKSVEKVKICNVENKVEIITPVLNQYTYEISTEKIKQKLDIELSTDSTKRLLERMMHRVNVGEKTVTVTVPEARSDILHECDILEDVAVAYGFNNLKSRFPEISTIGCETPKNKFANKIRVEMALFGYNEILSLTLLSNDENIVDRDLAAVLDNPKSKEYEVVRTSLLPGILKSIASNLHVKIPIKVFEVSDVVLVDNNTEEGARNERRLCAAIVSNKSLLEDVQGPLSLLFEKCGIKKYRYRPFEDNRYLKNQCAVVEVDDNAIGSIGVLHPDVCQKFEIPYAASSFEIDLDLLFRAFIKE